MNSYTERKWCLEHLNEPFPDWNEEDLAYCEKQFTESQDFMEKARCAYVLWVFKRKIDFARASVENFLAACDLYFFKGLYKEFEYYLTMAFAFRFAAKLSLALSLTDPLDIISILQKIRSMVKSMDANNEEGRGIYDLMDALASLSDDVYHKKDLKENSDVKSVFSDALKICDGIANRKLDAMEFEWQRSYLGYCALFARLDSGPDQTRAYKIKIAESFVQEAKVRNWPEFVRAIFLNSALKVYSEVGDSQKIEEMQRLIRESMEAAESKGEFKEITAPYEMPLQEIIEKIMPLYKGKQPQEILGLIAKDNSRFSSREDVVQSARKIRKDNPLSSILPRTIIDRGMPQEQLKEEGEIFDFEVARQLDLGAQISDKVQLEIYKELFPEMVTAEDLKRILKNSKNIKASTMKLIEKGLDQHFEGDYVSSIHILVPQIEEILRTFLLGKGKPASIYYPQAEGMQEKLLGGLLDDAEEFVDSRFIEYMRVKLTQKGANIRNKVCHGWIEVEELNEELSWMLIDIILRLSVVS